MQVCYADQSLVDSQVGRKRTWERRKKHRHGQCLCVCTATERVRLVKRKGSDQTRDELMDEAGGDTGKSGKYSRSHKACVHKLYCFMGMFLSHNLFPLLSWQMRAPTHPHINKLSPPCIPAYLPGRGSSTAIKDVATLRITALPCYPDYRIAPIKEMSTDVADVHTTFLHDLIRGA